MPPLHYLVQRGSWHVIDYIIDNLKNIELIANLMHETPVDLVPQDKLAYKAKLLKLNLRHVEEKDKSRHEELSTPTPNVIYLQQSKSPSESDLNSKSSDEMKKKNRKKI